MNSLSDHKIPSQLTDYVALPLEDKICRIKHWNVLTTFADVQWAKANCYGIRLDDLTVIDIDKRSKINDALAELDLRLGDTFTVETPRGIHIYYTGATRTVRAEWGEIKSTSGGYVVGPNCTRSDGQSYSVLHDIDIAPVPKAIHRLIQQPPKDSGPLWELQEGDRHSTLFEAACGMTRLYFSQEVVTNAIAHQNEELGHPLPDHEVERLARNAYQRVESEARTNLRMAGMRKKLQIQNKRKKDGVEIHFPVTLKMRKSLAEPLVVGEHDIPILGKDQLHWIYGEHGIGKSQAILALLRQHIRNGGAAAYIDGDEGYAGFVERLNIHSFKPKDAKRLAWMPKGTWKDESRKATKILQEAYSASNGDMVIVVDSATNCGCPPEGSAVDGWMNQFVDVFRGFDWTVIVLDHPPKKDLRQRERSPTGIGQKSQKPSIMLDVRPVNGAIVSKVSPGRFEFINRKDRHGLYTAQRDQVAFTMVAEPRKGGTLRMRFGPPSRVTKTETSHHELLATEVRKHHKMKHQPITNRELRDATKLGGAFATVLRTAVAQGLVIEQAGETKNSKVYLPGEQHD
ncbi:MAG: bifunctional DNA primase/polymerase [Gammaproteobacteria bacterium]|nr:bifunctional DNA primase/polymerase [Gammaproteobacteria bacterium]